MDERVARELLERLAASGVVLWRTASLAGGDLDVLVPDGADGELARAGLERRADGHWVADGGAVVVDPIAARDWPRHYPPAAAVLARAATGPGGRVRVAAAEDRLRILAADAVAGRPLSKLVPKLREALADGAPPRGDPLLDLGGDPDSLAACGAVLPWPRALRVAARSPRAAWALVVRAQRR